MATLMRNVSHGSAAAVGVHSVANTSRRGQIDADERRATLLQGGVAVIQPTASGSLGAVSWASYASRVSFYEVLSHPVGSMQAWHGVP